MNEQKIPGVNDAARPPITERAYAVLTLITVTVFVAAIVLVAQWRIPPGL